MTRFAVPLAALGAAFAVAAGAGAYPLDAYDETGITRLEAYRRAQRGEVRGRILPEGAMVGKARIGLRLADRPDFRLPEPDPELTRTVRGLLGEDARHYGVTVLDLSDPERPRYAEHNGRMKLNPGSVGKIMVALSLFDALAEAHPDDVAARERVLRNSMVTANGFIRTDSHTVPFWSPGDPYLVKRPIEQGDTASLWTYLDWMLSSSSNAAAAMVQYHALLLEHFGADYPVPPDAAEAFLRETDRHALGRMFRESIFSPLREAGIDLDELRQGSLFTREGKRRVAGTSSYSTSRELMRLLVKMDQGQLVDAWSSLELKRLLYLTDRRIRYASSPALYDAAVFYKSGSLYSCQPEPGFVCEKYHGNRLNYMNSVAIVEDTSGPVPLYYLTVVTSNVLRKNSAVAHQTFATRLHRRIASSHEPRPPEPLPEKFPPGEPRPAQQAEASGTDEDDGGPFGPR